VNLFLAGRGTELILSILSKLVFNYSVRLKVFICLALALITFGLYWPARHFMFLYYDDTFFIACPQVSAGLSWYGILWAIQGLVAQNWHPITTFTYPLMHQFFGLNPGAEHLLNAAIHAANAALLFLVLKEMTGKVWPSAIVAAIFAWHPLRVESVAFISERKDVLFMFFMLLSLLCYTRYTRAGPGKPLPSPDKHTIFDTPPRTYYYNLALLCFILSFLSKAMVVTLPFLLVLLDFWPLKRFNAGWTREDGKGTRKQRSLQLSNSDATPKPVEGQPILEPGGSQSLLTSADTETGAPKPLARARGAVWPFASRFQSLVKEKTSFFVLDIIFCALTFWIQKTQGAVKPLSEVGIGIRLENAVVSYVSYLGKFFWPTKLAAIYPYPQHFQAIQILLMGLLLAAISAFCVLQTRRRPYLAVGWFWYLGTLVPVIGLVQVGMQGMADRYTYLPLIGPAISVVWLVSDWAQGRQLLKIAAISGATAALAVCAFLTTRQLPYWRDTVTLFERTTAITPANALAEYPLALGFEHVGDLRRAAVHYRIALELQPDDDHFMASFYFAEDLTHLGQYREAVARLQAALQLQPDSPEAMNNLAWILSTCPKPDVRDGERAVQLAERSCKLTNDESPTYLTTLATAYAEVGRFDDAISTVQKAGELAQEQGQMQIFNGDAQLLQVFMNHQTFTDKGK
jgi:protein O-mannosyl-transferase